MAKSVIVVPILDRGFDMTIHTIHFSGPIMPISAERLVAVTLDVLSRQPTQISLHLSTEGGNLSAGFMLYHFLHSLPVPVITHNIGSVESIGIVVFLAGERRFACPHSRFLIHPLHWTFGTPAADHQRLVEWGKSLDFDAQRYAQIVNEATQGSDEPLNIGAHLEHDALIVGPAAAVKAGLVHDISLAKLPPDGVNWWVGASQA